MAGRRKPSTENDTTTTTEEVTVSTTTPDETVEQLDTVTEDTVAEAPVEEVAAEAPAEAPVEEAPIDLTAFNAAVAESIKLADETTGALPDAAIASAVAEYQKLDGAKAKAAARSAMEDAMRASLEGKKFYEARSYMDIKDNLKSTAKSGSKTPKAPKEPVDPTPSFVESIVTLLLAGTLAQADVPEGVSDEWAEQVREALNEAQPLVDAYKAWQADESEDKGDAPEVPAYVPTAIKLAHRKPGRAVRVPSAAYSGPQRDVGKHIDEAFAAVESGAFLTVAEIRKHKSSEYGEDQPSAGAISARLFPKSGKVTVEGVTPGENENGIKGATKN